MKRWIAYEHDETGWPTEGLVIVQAKTQAQARRVMAAAIAARRDAEASLQRRARLSAIFIEAPTELGGGDARFGSTDTADPIFIGFDRAERRPPKPLASRRRRRP